MKRLLAILILALFATPALAAPVRTLVATPASPHVGEETTFSGCGYGSLRDISILAAAPGSEEEWFKVGTRADEDGCFTTAGYPVHFYEAGEWELYVYFKHGSGVSDYGNGQAILEQDLEVLP